MSDIIQFPGKKNRETCTFERGDVIISTSRHDDNEYVVVGIEGSQGAIYRQDGYTRLLTHDGSGCVIICVNTTTGEPRRFSELTARSHHNFALSEQRATEDEIVALIAKGEQLKAEEIAAKEVARLAREELTVKLREEYKHLIPVQGSEKSGLVIAAKNLRTLLKAAWPAVKFSVRSSSFSGGDSIDIGWTDGPTTKQVDEIAQQFKAGSFNGMEDIYEYSSSVFIEIFGDAKYVSVQRDLSDAAKIGVAVELGYKPEQVDLKYHEIEGWNTSTEGRERSEAYRRACYERDYDAKPINAPQKPQEEPQAEVSTIVEPEAVEVVEASPVSSEDTAKQRAHQIAAELLYQQATSGLTFDEAVDAELIALAEIHAVRAGVTLQAIMRAT